MKTRVQKTGLRGLAVLLGAFAFGGCDNKENDQNFFPHPLPTRSIAQQEVLPKYTKIENGINVLTSEGLAFLESKGVPKDKAMEYNVNSIPDDWPVVAKSRLETLAIWYAGGITPEKYNSLSSRFGHDNTFNILENKVPIDDIESYDFRFGIEDIVNLSNAQVKGKDANEFNKRFSASEIVRHFKGKKENAAEMTDEMFIEPSVANSYDERLRAIEIVTLVENKIDAQTAKEYLDSKFDADDAIRLSKAGITPQNANSYPDINWNRTSEIISLHEAGISGEDARGYFEFKNYHYNREVEGAIQLHKTGMTGGEVSAFAKLINNYRGYAKIELSDLEFFHKAKISPKEVEERIKPLAIDRAIKE